MDWSPDGAMLAVDSGDETMTILHLPTGDQLNRFKVAPNLWAFDWSPDGNRIAIGSTDGVVQIWDVSHLPDVSDLPTITPLLTLVPVSTATDTP
jgi:WD40 repeat protein